MLQRRKIYSKNDSQNYHLLKKHPFTIFDFDRQSQKWRRSNEVRAYSTIIM
jgi:hypothetical protein